MMYWTGSFDAVTAAEAVAAAIVISLPAYLEGEEVDNPTVCWDIPRETATAGVWAIHAYPDMVCPDGCTEVETVEWPETEED